MATELPPPPDQPNQPPPPPELVRQNAHTGPNSPQDGGKKRKTVNKTKRVVKKAVRCSAKTLDGKRCKSTVMRGKRCHRH